MDGGGPLSVPPPSHHHTGCCCSMVPRRRGSPIKMAHTPILLSQMVEECMEHRVGRIVRTVRKWATVLAVIGMAATANTSAGRADQADAKRLLKAMSDYLGAQKAISF